MNQIKIGKILSYDDNSQVGKIIDSNGNTYLFLKKDYNEQIELLDVVQFRAEQIENNLRAFFVKKIDLQKIENIDYYIDKKNDFKGKQYNYN